MACGDYWKTQGERRKKVGHYMLGACLGGGSFSKMRQATHVIAREQVAVKVISKRVIIRCDAARRNFRREALLLQHVCHPNVIHLYEAMETPNNYYLVFELAAGGNLLNYITEQRCLQEGECRHFLRQMASAVDHLHQSGIVHRDLKLENFLLTDKLVIKIVDFGLSALCQRESDLTTQCGSPIYAAPEIFGNRRYGPPVDVWSIGVCLYAMAVGRLPFLPDPPTNLAQLHALILKGAVIPDFLSAGLKHLLSGMLEVQESRRLSAAELLNQSWLTCQRSQPIPRYPPVTKAPPPVISTDVIRYMTSVFSFSENDVIHSVTERKLNSSSSTYHLLSRHMDEENSFEEIREKGETSVGNTRPTTLSRGSAVTLNSDVVTSSDAPHSQVPVNDEHSQTNRSKLAREPSNYKECILFLKEARKGLALNGKPFANLQHDLVKDSTVPSSQTKPVDGICRKLPLLNLHKGTGSSGPSHQGLENVRHYIPPIQQPDMDLNVLGRPVLKGKGVNNQSLEEQVNNSTLGQISQNETSSSGAKPTRVPPNTAHGPRTLNGYTWQKSSESASNSSSWADSSPRPDSSLKDPFGQDTWLLALAQGRHQAGAGGGMEFVQPMSSPKALTSRGEVGAARVRQGCYVLRRLAADLSRKRGNGLVTKPAQSHALPPVKCVQHCDYLSDYEDQRSDSPFSEALPDNDHFLTPVIRVTIRSTAKH